MTPVTWAGVRTPHMRCVMKPRHYALTIVIVAALYFTIATLLGAPAAAG